jgi:hypothetical protein
MDEGWVDGWMDGGWVGKWMDGELLGWLINTQKVIKATKRC